MFTFGFYLTPAILWVILFLVARNAGGDRSYSTLFFVSLGIFAISVGLNIFIPQFAIFAVPIVCILMIRRFCYIGWLRAIVATVLYMAWMIGFSVLFDKAIRPT